MVRIIYMVMLMVSASVISSCSTHKAAADPAPLTVKADVPVMGSRPLGVLPKAVIYKMNGDYASLVPVTLDASGNKIASYPAPTDLSEQSMPLALGDGWYLDRRGGIGPNTAFLKYTYTEYMAMPKAPSPSSLMADIVAKAKVTETKVLPMTLNEALADTAALQKYVK